MDGKKIFSYILLICILGSAAYWFFTRPTAQDKTVIYFFDELRRGNVKTSADYLVNGSYGSFILKSKILDSDGIDLKESWGETEEQLETIARDNIPYARGAVLKFDVESIRTQRVKSDKNLAYVIFKINFGIKEGLDQPSIPARVEGTATLKKIDNKWLIESAEFSVWIEGRSIKKYIDLVNY
jgi:hypothetical protein